MSARVPPAFILPHSFLIRITQLPLWVYFTPWVCRNYGLGVYYTFIKNERSCCGRCFKTVFLFSWRVIVKKREVRDLDRDAFADIWMIYYGNSTKRSQFAVRFFTLDSPLVTPLSAWWPFLRTGVLNCRKINRFYGSTRFIYFGKPFGSRIVIFAVNQAIKSDEQLISRVVRSSCLRSLWIFFD